jgi:Domain of unknown function (DUF5615)
VAAIAEISPRATDEVVMELAIREGSIPLTEDKDFGQLIHANPAATGGVPKPRRVLEVHVTGAVRGLFRTWHAAVLADPATRLPISARVRLLQEELGSHRRRAEAANGDPTRSQRRG